MTKHFAKKLRLGKANRKTKWTTIWAVVKKHGQGKRIHPSQMTAQRRNWRRAKLKLKARRAPKSHLG